MSVLLKGENVHCNCKWSTKSSSVLWLSRSDVLLLLLLFANTVFVHPVPLEGNT